MLTKTLNSISKLQIILLSCPIKILVSFKFWKTSLGKECSWTHSFEAIFAVFGMLARDGNTSNQSTILLGCETPWKAGRIRNTDECTQQHLHFHPHNLHTVTWIHWLFLFQSIPLVLFWSTQFFSARLQPPVHASWSSNLTAVFQNLCSNLCIVRQNLMCVRHNLAVTKRRKIL